MGARSTFTLPEEKDRPAPRKLSEKERVDDFYARIRKADDEWQQEKAARESAAKQPYYNPSLAMAIVDRLGPGFQSAYRPDRKHYLHTPQQGDIHGTYALEDHPKAYDYGTLQMVKDHLYGIGPEPSARTFAHEYRHRAGVENEYINREYDAMYSKTPDDWKDAVSFWKDQMRRSEPDKKVSDAEAEQALLQQLKQDRDFLLEKEWDAAPENDKPAVFEEPSLGGFFTDMLLGQEGNFYFQDKLPYEKIPGVIKPEPPVPQPPIYRYSPNPPPHPKRTNR